MANKLMKTWTIMGTTYEICDDYAREEIKLLQDNKFDAEDIDLTLSIEGKLADAKIIGDRFNEMQETINTLDKELENYEDTSKVKISGDKMTGALETPGLTIAVGENVELLPMVLFGDYQEDTLVITGAIQNDPKTGVIGLLNKCVDGTGYCEYFALPTPDEGRTEDGLFGILTTKEPVSIENGGFGGTTAKEARVNIGAVNKDKTTIKLTTANWVDNSQTVNVETLEENSDVLISVPNEYYVYNGVKCISQAEGSLTFVCERIPSVDIDVNVLILT